MIVRNAELRDYSSIIRFANHFHDISDYKDVPFSAKSALRWFDRMREEGLLLVTEQDGILTGVSGGLFSPFLANDSYKVGCELLWWVEPEYRGSEAGRLMFDELEKQARDKGAHRWTMIALEASSPDRIGKIYKRKGYSISEYAYSKVL